MENSTPPTSQGADDAPTIPSTKAQAFSELPRLTIPSPDNPKPVLVSGPDRTSQSPESASSRAWSALSDSDSITAPAPSFGNPIRAVRPPRPISKDYPRPTTASTTRPTTASTTRPMTASTIRPMTASTKRMSMSSIASKKTIKYGTGKHARVELVPQPSDDPEDPLVSAQAKRQVLVQLTRHPELAHVEKESQLLLAPLHDGHHRGHENHVGDREQHHSHDKRRILHRGRGADRRSADDVWLERNGRPGDREGVRQAPGLPVFDGCHLYRSAVECLCEGQLRPEHDSADIPGSGLGRLRHIGYCFASGHLLRWLPCVSPFKGVSHADMP